MRRAADLTRAYLAQDRPQVESCSTALSTAPFPRWETRLRAISVMSLPAPYCCASGRHRPQLVFPELVAVAVALPDDIVLKTVQPPRATTVVWPMIDAVRRLLGRQQPRGRYTPRLQSVWIVARLALAMVGVLACGLFLGVEVLLTAENRAGKPVDVNDVIKTTVTLLTLIGAVLTGVYAYRKQLLAEGDSHRADASQLAERYATAAEQLGHEQAAVRLAGVYAMARLADDWPEQRQVCIDVLCAYLRMPYGTDPTATGFKAGEREVRHTIIRIIRNHLQDPAAPTTWCGRHLDFTGATFDGGDFYRAQFTGSSVSFKGAQFTDGAFFFCARFTGSRVAFDDARFAGGLVTFNDAQFTDGLVTFVAASFAGSRVTFQRAQFAGGTVSFLSARFAGGTVTFDGAQVTDGEVAFDGVRVESAVDVDWGPFPAIPPRAP